MLSAQQCISARIKTSVVHKTKQKRISVHRTERADHGRKQNGSSVCSACWPVTVRQKVSVLGWGGQEAGVNHTVVQLWGSCRKSLQAQEVMEQSPKEAVRPGGGVEVSRLGGRVCRDALLGDGKADAGGIVVTGRPQAQAPNKGEASMKSKPGTQGYP